MSSGEGPYDRLHDAGGEQHSRRTGVDLVSTTNAAWFIGVTPNAIRKWEQEYGFPTASLHENRRRFPLAEVLALRVAAQRGAKDGDAVREALAMLAFLRGDVAGRAGLQQ